MACRFPVCWWIEVTNAPGCRNQPWKKLNLEREKKDLTSVMANRRKITRSVGFAIIRVEKNITVDEVVPAAEGYLMLPGARTLAGLSMMVNSRRKKLVASGPLPAA